MFFVLLIMGTNLVFLVAPSATRDYITRSLRSPNGESVRDLLHHFPALRPVARTAVMDTESFVRMQSVANYVILTAFFFYLGFLRGLSAGALRLSLRLFFLVAATYSFLLLFDTKPLGHERSAERWFLSAGTILTAATAFANYLLVRRTMPGRDGVGLRIFWGLATAGFALAALDARFQLRETLLSGPTLDADLQQRYVLVGALLTSLLLIALFQRSLRVYRLVSAFDAHKPLWLAMLFFTLAVSCRMTQTSGKVRVYFGHLENVCWSAAVVLFLAAFAAAVACHAAAHLRAPSPDAAAAPQAPEPATSEVVSEAELEARREPPLIVREEDVSEQSSVY
jgi:hypothetical protein